MYAVVIVLILVLSLLLVIAILAQNSKGGVGSQFGGSGASQVMGVKRTGDFLERATWTLGAAILVLTLSTSFMIQKGDSQEGSSSVNANRAAEQAIPAGTVPDLAPAAEGTPTTESTPTDMSDEFSSDSDEASNEEE